MDTLFSLRISCLFCKRTYVLASSVVLQLWLFLVFPALLQTRIILGLFVPMTLLFWLALPYLFRKIELVSTQANFISQKIQIYDGKLETSFEDIRKLRDSIRSGFGVASLFQSASIRSGIDKGVALATHPSIKSAISITGLIWGLCTIKKTKQILPLVMVFIGGINFDWLTLEGLCKLCTGIMPLAKRLKQRAFPEQRPEEPFHAQGEGDSIFTDAFLALCRMFVPSFGAFGMADAKAMSSMRSGLGLIKDGASLTSYIVKVIYHAFYVAYYHATGKPFFTDANEVLIDDASKWIEEIRTLAKTIVNTDHIYQKPELLIKIHYLHAKMIDLDVRLLKANYTQTNFTAFYSAKNIIEKFESSAKIAEAQNTSRILPVFIHLTGAPDQGKSACMKTLISDLAYLENLPVDIDLEYNRKPASDFWDGYRNQFACVVDDIFQYQDQDAISMICQEIIFMCNCAAFPLNMAELDKKGASFFTSRLVIATSNGAKLPQCKLQSKDAFYRRQDFLYELIKTQDPDPNEVIDTSVWRFSELDKFKQTHTGNILTYDQVVRKAHQLLFMRRTAPSNNIEFALRKESVDERQRRLRGYFPQANDEVKEEIPAKLVKSNLESSSGKEEEEVPLNRKVPLPTTRVMVDRPLMDVRDPDVKKSDMGVLNDSIMAAFNHFGKELFANPHFEKSYKDWAKCPEISCVHRPPPELFECEICLHLNSHKNELENISKFLKILKLEDNPDAMDIYKAIMACFKLSDVPARLLTHFFQRPNTIYIAGPNNTFTEHDRTGAFKHLIHPTQLKVLETIHTPLHFVPGPLVDGNETMQKRVWCPICGIDHTKVPIQANVAEMIALAARNASSPNSESWEYWDGVLKDFKFGTLSDTERLWAPRLETFYSMTPSLNTTIIVGCGVYTLYKNRKSIAGLVTQSFAFLGLSSKGDDEDEKEEEEGSYEAEGGVYRSGRPNQVKKVVRGRPLASAKNVKWSGARRSEMKAEGRDDSASSIINGPLIRNLKKVQIVGIYDDGKTTVKTHCNILFIKKKIAIGSAHTMRHIMESKQSYVEMDGVVIPHKFIQVGIAADLDLGIMMFSAHSPIHEFADIMKHFLKEDDLHVDYTDSAVLVVKREENLHILNSTRAHLVTQASYTYTARGETRNVEIYSGLVANLDSMDGDCGAPYVIFDSNCPRKIIGIHVAGNNHGSAMAAIITQETLENFSLDEQYEAMLAQGDDEYSNEIHLSPQICIPITPGCDNELMRVHKVYGQVAPQYAHRLPHKTDIIPSLIQGELSEIVTMPAKLHGRNEDGLTPFEVGLKKLAIPNFELDKEVADDLRDIAQDILDSLPHNYPARKLTISEAINGVRHWPNIERLNLDTSVGWKFAKFGLKTENLKGKRAYLTEDEHGDWIPNKFLLDEINFLEKGYLEKSDPPVVFALNLKTERRPIEKVRLGKTRIFSGGPIDFTIVERQYLGAFVQEMMADRSFLASKVGINPHGVEWKELYDYLKSVHIECLPTGGDYGNFDGSLCYQLMITSCWIIDQWYKADPTYARDEDSVVRNGIFESFCRPLFIGMRTLFRSSHGNPSGHVLTTIINNLCNELVIMQSAMALFRHAGFKNISVKDVRAVLKMCCFGDDNILSQKPETKDILYLQAFQDIIRKNFGMEYTDFKKRPTEVMQHTWEEVEFLKRNFRKGDYGEIYAPLEMEVILEMMNWVSSKIDPGEATVQNCETALRESFHHGRDVFESLKKRVNFALDAANLPKIRLSWFDCEVNWERGSYQSFVEETTLTAQGNEDVEDIREAVVEEKTEEKQLTSFDDHVSVQLEKGPLDFSTAYGLSDPYPYQGLKEVLSRVYTSSYTWTSTTNSGQQLFSIDLPRDHLNAHQNLLDKLKRFQFFRAATKLEFRVNGTRFHQGLLMVSYAPHVQSMPSDIFSLSVYPTVYLSPNTGQTVAVIVPYVAPSTYWDMAENSDDPALGFFGLVKAYVVNPLGVSSEDTVPQVSVSVMISFVDPQVAGPSLFDTPAFKAQGKDEEEKEKEEEEDKGVSDEVIDAFAQKLEDEMSGMNVEEVLEEPHDFNEERILWQSSNDFEKLVSLKEQASLVEDAMNQISTVTIGPLNRMNIGVQWFADDLENPVDFDNHTRCIENSVNYSKALDTAQELADSFLAKTDKKFPIEIVVIGYRFRFCGDRECDCLVDPDAIVIIDSRIVGVCYICKKLKAGHEFKAEGKDRTTSKKEAKDMSEKGIVSTTFNRIGDAFQSLTSLPLIGDVASVAAPVAKTVGTIASFFGYDKPTSLRVYDNYMPNLTTNFCPGVGLEVTNKISVDPENEVSTDVSIYGDKKDYSCFSNYKLLPGLISVTSIDTTVVPDDIFLTLPITPCMNYTWYDTYPSPTQSVIHNTPTSALASLFRYWRGSMKIAIRVVTSSFTTLRYRISWHPSQTSIPTTVSGGAGDFISTIVDVTGDGMFTFTIPYLQDTPYLRSAPYDATNLFPSTSSLDGTFNGYLLLSLVNDIAYSGPSTAVSVWFNIWASAGEDMMFYRPQELWSNYSAQGGDEIDTTDMRSIFEKTFPPLITASSQVIHGLVHGEEVQDFKTLMHRFGYYGTEDFTSINYVNINPFPATVNGHTNFGLINKFFIFNRGSWRLKVLAGATRPSTDVFNWYATIRDQDILNVQGNPLDNLGTFNGYFFQDPQLRRCLEVEIPFYSGTYMRNGVMGWYSKEDSSNTTCDISCPGYTTVVYTAIGEDYSWGFPKAPPHYVRTLPLSKSDGKSEVVTHDPISLIRRNSARQSAPPSYEVRK